MGARQGRIRESGKNRESCSHHCGHHLDQVSLKEEEDQEGEIGMEGGKGGGEEKKKTLGLTKG